MKETFVKWHLSSFLFAGLLILPIVSIFYTSIGESNELFSEMFHQVNSGQLMETGTTFIEDSLKELDLKVAEDFIENVEILEKLKDNIFLNAITKAPEISSANPKEEVVVKPSDIAKSVLGGDKL